MSEFLTTHKVYLTPISPIHIGCGEDFEPTNYVIKENNIYCFEASKLGLSESQRRQLIDICRNITDESIQQIQSFFAKKDVIGLAVNNAYTKIPVASKIADEWKKKLGKVVQREDSSKKVFNALLIERHAYLPFCNQAYIPASSVKGSVITALLDNANQSDKTAFSIPVKQRTEKKEDYAKKLKALNDNLVHRYIGDFNAKNDEKIISQRIKFSDFVPTNKDISLTKVIYAVNVKKILGKDKNAFQGVNNRRECISAMQFRAYSASLTLLNENNKFSLQNKQIINALNAYNLPVLEKEIQLLNDNDLMNARNYIENVKAVLKNENVALIRLGRSGSEVKMYREHNLRALSVNGEISKESHTLWVASDSTEKSETIQPFGWALLEFANEQEDNVLLEKWCSNPKSSLQNYLKDLELEKAIQKQQNALNSLPENQRKVIELENKFNASNEKQIDSSSDLLKEVKLLIENEAINWNKEDKQFMAEHITKELILKRVELKKKNADKDLDKLLKKLVVE
ncbi:RAMP superfamily CRISPR-associated protein [Mannheimia massilioguelmaensis]|uniref:RAMP superfamily CRISPR-associated protein n=1 Tax=Mannheimia massilioguelmaensis TaxID=1604354 RepID=UPI0005CAACFC|nr:RAMP superfamily CRISPR-associated protein [Mannheimia massilioguelmaensis]